MQESMEEMAREASVEDLCEEFTGAVYEMEPEDLEKLKKKPVTVQITHETVTPVIP